MFIPKGISVNKDRCKDVLFCLLEGIYKCPEMEMTKDLVFLHDKGLTHWLLLVQQPLAKHGVMVLHHLLLCVYNLFSTE
jgi:hypothetical protein